MGGASGVAGASIAQALNTRIEVPCQGAHEGDLCSSAQSLPPQMLSVGGNPELTYQVKLRVRGVTEAHTFNDANGETIATETAAPYFLDSSGGTPNEDAHALFWIDVPTPAEKYYLNAYYTVSGSVDHQLFVLDYEATILVKGGSVVTFNFKDDNTEQSANVSLVVPGIPPAPQVFDGQFVQLDVLEVSPAQ